MVFRIFASKLNMFRFALIVGGVPIMLTAMAVPQPQVQAGASARVSQAHPKQPSARSETIVPAGPVILTPVGAEAQRPAATPLPERVPPLPPKIVYQNGLLTIEATNSTLGDVLSGIHEKTGIEFEGLDSAPERVVFFSGPAPSEAVLVNLLQGSRFNYIIIGQPDNQEVAQKVLLSPPAAGSASDNPAGAFSRPNQQPASTEDTDSAEAAAPIVPQTEQPNQTELSNYGPRAKPGVWAQQLRQRMQQQQNEANQQPPTVGGSTEPTPPNPE